MDLPRNKPSVLGFLGYPIYGKPQSHQDVQLLVTGLRGSPDPHVAVIQQVHLAGIHVLFEFWLLWGVGQIKYDYCEYYDDYDYDCDYDYKYKYDYDYDYYRYCFIVVNRDVL